MKRPSLHRVFKGLSRAAFSTQVMELAAGAGTASHPLRVFLYGLVSGIVGDRLCYRQDPSPSRAVRLDILLTTPGDTLPGWISTRWDHAISVHDGYDRSAHAVVIPPKELSRMIKRLKVMEDRLLDQTEDAIELRRSVEHSRNYRPMRPLHRMEAGRKAPGDKANGRGCVLAISEPAQLGRWIERTAGRRDGRPGTRLTGWVSLSDLRKLARRFPLGTLSRAAWIIQAPQGELVFQEDDDPGVLGNRRLHLANLTNEGCSFRPRGRARALIEGFGNVIGEILSTLPECMGGDILPDGDLEWHLAAAASAIHSTDEELNDKHGFDDGWTSEVMLDAYRLVLQHAHNLRICYPCDQQGWFEGDDLALFRNLQSVPRSVRELQRSVSSIRKPGILSFLDRAIGAGLAVEASPGRFATAPPPAADVSEIASKITVWLQKNYDGPFFPTDTTDNPRFR